MPVIDGLGIAGAPWLPGLNGQAAALGIFFVYAGVICSAATAVVYTRTALGIIRASKGGER